MFYRRATTSMFGFSVVSAMAVFYASNLYSSNFNMWSTGFQFNRCIGSNSRILIFERTPTKHDHVLQLQSNHRART